jgi:hypothetical protein
MEASAKVKLTKGTPEGDKMVEVRCMRDVMYGPTPKLERLYFGPCDAFPEGEKLTIPMWRFTDWHETEVIRGITFRGSFERLDRPKPINTNVSQHPEELRELIDQNEDYAKRIADLEKRLEAAPEPTVTVDEPAKRGGKSKREEI